MANEENEFDWDTYYEEGEELYKQYASDDPVFDPRFEDVPMFNKEGGYSQAYINATGMEGVTSSTGGATLREAYFDKKRKSLKSGMSPKERAASALFEMHYGDQPRYKKTEDGSHELRTPYLLEKIYKGETKDMDAFDKMDFDKMFSSWIESMPTDTSGRIEDKIIDQFKKNDAAPWETTNTKYKAGE